MNSSSIGQFSNRHFGLDETCENEVLQFLGYTELEDFIASVVPKEILDPGPPLNKLPSACNESMALEELEHIAKKNKQRRSLIGLGYYGTITPALIQRQIIENPGWYTSYTPYQAEISQGRLEALFNFQTLISELTGLPIANASLLDEATAAAEAMSLSFSVNRNSQARTFLVDREALPQTLSVLKTRAEPLGLLIQEVDTNNIYFDENVFGLFYTHSQLTLM